jgi:DeoR/GlpR family transcriptional regulator of sugar metabolism
VAVALAEYPPLKDPGGGRLFKSSQVAIGAAAIETIKQTRADLCMLGVCSVHPEAGVSVPDSEEAYVKRAMIESSAEVQPMVSAEKLGTAAPSWLGRSLH